MQHFEKKLDSDLAVKSRVVELLNTPDELKRQRAIVTSSASIGVERYLQAKKLSNRFHHILANGDYLANKCAPYPFFIVAERLIADPQLCLALEDLNTGVHSTAD